MLRWLAPREPGIAVQEQLLEAVAQYRAKPRAKVKVPAWAKWLMEKKVEVVKYYTDHGYRALRLKYSQTPPPSTIRCVKGFTLCPFLCFSLRTWREQLRLKGSIKPAGRPRWLDEREEKSVLDAFCALRHRCEMVFGHGHFPFFSVV